MERKLDRRNGRAAGNRARMHSARRIRPEPSGKRLLASRTIRGDEEVYERANRRAHMTATGMV
jgi:hypothetical protein